MTELDRKYKELSNAKREADKIRSEAHKAGDYKKRDLFRARRDELDKELSDLFNSRGWQLQEKARKEAYDTRKLLLKQISEELDDYYNEGLSVILAMLKTGKIEVTLTAEKE